MTEVEPAFNASSAPDIQTASTKSPLEHTSDGVVVSDTLNGRPRTPPPKAEHEAQASEIRTASSKPPLEDPSDATATSDNPSSRPRTPTSKAKHEAQDPRTPTRVPELDTSVGKENGVVLHDIADTPSPKAIKHFRQESDLVKQSPTAAVSEWSHQQLAPQAAEAETGKDPLGGWQTMPSYADWDMFDDDGKQIAQARPEAEIVDEGNVYAGLGGAGKGYTKVEVDDDAKSTTSMDDNTAYLFKESRGTGLDEEDEEGRDPLEQMQATKNLLNDNQKIAYVGLVRLAMADMLKVLESHERTRGSRKQYDLALEAFMMWTQKMMLRLYGHMQLDSAEQVMIEQLSEHGLQPQDLTPSLMENARVKNPMQNENESSQSLARASDTDENDAKSKSKSERDSDLDPVNRSDDTESLQPPPSISEEQPPPEYEGHDDLDVQLPSELPQSENIDIDLRWTVLCDLFLVLISDSLYDSRSRTLLEKVGSYLDVTSLEICRFEKRVTEALEMQEEKEKEKWNEDEHVAARAKLAKRRRLMMMGLATAGGTLVIGLSGGLLGPVIGAGLAAGFATIGVTGTSTFLGGVAATAIIGTGSAVAGGAMGAKASHRRTGAVKTFEYRPLYNNKRVNLILTISGWLNGKVDDPRLPFSTVDPVMGDLYSLWWEPEMLQSTGQTMSILATEALTQALQQVLGSTILIPLMGALQLPIILSKLTYLVDNPWSVSLARADRAGLILADSLVDRNLGARPITLVGFSIGARVIFAALQELAKRGGIGLIQNVFLFGSPVVAKKDDYLKARTVVADRFVNGYSTTDWILSYLFRATSGGISRVAGLATVDVGGIENIEVTKYVNGHMAYRQAMPKLLREVGIAITSDEFTEIEDPDPDNHEARQRELINEIEEARKDIHDDKSKKGWGWFKRKKAAERSKWEVYDEKSQKTDEDPGAQADPEGVLFDIEAIRKEVVEIGAQGLEVKQLESTMPTLKLDDEAVRDSTHRPVENLRGTKSDITLPMPRSSFERPGTPRSLGHDGNGADHDIHEDEVTMTFDSGEVRPSTSRAQSDWGVANSYTNGARGISEERLPSARATTPAAAPLDKNVWSDEDEFQEKEQVEMSFA